MAADDFVASTFGTGAFVFGVRHFWKLTEVDSAAAFASVTHASRILPESHKSQAGKITAPFFQKVEL